MRLSLIILVLAFLSSCASYESEADILSKFDSIKTGPPKDKINIRRAGQLIVTVPNKKDAKIPVLFIFGGMHYATPDFMLKETPELLFEKAVLVFAPCRAMGGQGFNAYKKQLLPLLHQQGKSVRGISICGFSGGGPDALEAEGADIRLIGLIDAVPEIPQKRRHYPMLINAFNIQNWRGNELYNNSNFSNFAKWTKKEGGILEETNVKHEQFPKYFLYRYRNRLIS
jgi:hypothetical protein